MLPQVIQDAIEQPLDEDLPARVPVDIDQAHGLIQDELSTANADFNGQTNRTDALAYYNGEEMAQQDAAFRTEDGVWVRSVVKSGVIYDQVNALLDQAWPTLKSEMLAEYEPLSEQDEQSAQNESIAAHHVIMKRNQGAIALAEAMWDAALLRNGVLRVWVDDRLETSVDTYDEVNPMGLQQLYQQAEESADSDDAIEILSVTETRQEPIFIPYTRIQIGAESIYSVEVKRWTRKPQLRVEAWPVENFRRKSTARAVDLQDCEFCAFCEVMSRAAAKDRGYPPELVDQITSGTDTELDQTAQARNRVATETRDWSSDHESEQIIIWECYWRYDLDGDGQAELNKVELGGWNGEIWLGHERAGYIPAAVGVVRLYPHRFEGDSYYDSHKHVHDAKTGILRGWNNSVASALQGGTIVNVTQFDDPDDVYKKELERVLRVTGDVRTALAHEPWNDITPAAVPALEYWDKLSAQRGGGGVDQISEAVPVGGNTAHGTERHESSRELPLERSLGTFMATGAVSLWKLVHHVLRTDYGDTISVRKPSGVWITEDPARWSPRESVNLVSGLTLGERLRRSAHLSMEIETMLALKEQGSTLVDENGLHTALMARAHANQLTGASSWWVDPMSPQGQQASQAQQQQAQEMQAKEEEMRQAGLKLQTALAEAELYKAQAATEKQRAEQFKMFIEASGMSIEQQQKDRDLDIKDRDSRVDAAVKIAELGIEAEQVKQDAERLDG